VLEHSQDASKKGEKAGQLIAVPLTVGTPNLTQLRRVELDPAFPLFSGSHSNRAQVGLGQIQRNPAPTPKSQDGVPLVSP